MNFQQMRPETAGRLNPVIQLGDDVLQACEDAQVEGLETDLALAISDLSAKHAAALVALKRDVFAAGAAPKETGTWRGVTERTISGVKSAFMDIDGQSRALVALSQHARWQDAAREVLVGGLPAEQQDLLNSHYEATRIAADTVDCALRHGGSSGQAC